MQRPTVTQGEKELVVFNKGVQRGHVPSTLIPEGQSQMRLTQDEWQKARQNQSILTPSQKIDGMLMHHGYK